MALNFATFLRKLVRRGNVEVQTADGVTHVLGDGSGPPLGIKLTDKAAELELVFNPALKFGELFLSLIHI